MATVIGLLSFRSTAVWRPAPAPGADRRLNARMIVDRRLLFRHFESVDLFWAIPNRISFDLVKEE
jgi:hypothetical protein